MELAIITNHIEIVSNATVQEYIKSQINHVIIVKMVYELQDMIVKDAIMVYFQLKKDVFLVMDLGN